MTERDQLARPVVRRRASFHADQAGRKIGEEADHLAPAQLSPHQNRSFAAESNPMVTASCCIFRLLDVDLQRPHLGTATLVQGPSTPSRHDAPVETINGLYKADVIWRQRSWANASAVEMATLRWVELFNNPRLFGPIGDITPAEAEANYYAAIDLDRAA